MSVIWYRNGYFPRFVPRQENIWDEAFGSLGNFLANGKPLEEVLIQQYIEMFQNDWKEYEKLSWQNKEQLSFCALMDSKLRTFVGRAGLLEEYYQNAIKKNTVLILRGESGSGKTAIMCKPIERLKQEMNSKKQGILTRHYYIIKNHFPL